MSKRRLAFTVLGAVVAAVATVVVLRLLGVQNAGVIAGGVAGGVAGAIGGSMAATAKR